MESGRSFFSGFGITLLILIGFYFQKNVELIIEEPFEKITALQIPWRDAKRLDSFFREITISQPLAYTLGGYKPISFACYRNQGTSLASFSLSNLRIIRGWGVWKKYRHHFNNTRIQFWEEKSPFVNGVSWLVVADHKLCDQILKEYILDFKKIFGESLSPSIDLLKDVETVPFFKNALQKNELLIGLLLGFGYENALLYSERSKELPFRKLPEIWGTLMKEERRYYSRKQFTFQTMTMTDLLLPVFVGDPDSDPSKKIKQKYLEARGKIQQFYVHRSFLNATLSLYKYGSQLLDESP